MGHRGGVELSFVLARLLTILSIVREMLNAFVYSTIFTSTWLKRITLEDTGWDKFVVNF